MVSVISVFLTLFEPCLSPSRASFFNQSDLSSAPGPILLQIAVSDWLELAPLPPDSPPGLVQIQALLSAPSNDRLAQISIDLIETADRYQLSFSRPSLPSPLMSCSSEEASLKVSPSFPQPLNISLQAGEGFLDVKSLLTLQFLTFSAAIREGPITIGIVTCLDSFTATTGGGDISVASVSSSHFWAETGAGTLFLNSPFAGDYHLETKRGDIVATTMTLSPSGPSDCHLSARTARGSILISLVDLIATDPCLISLDSREGDVKVAIRGFAGRFDVQVEKRGELIIPGFDECNGVPNCSGMVDPLGNAIHAVSITARYGNIELFFV